MPPLQCGAIAEVVLAPSLAASAPGQNEAELSLSRHASLVHKAAYYARTAWSAGKASTVDVVNRGAPSLALRVSGTCSTQSQG